MPLTRFMLTRWTFRCKNCGQVTTTFYDPNGDNWVLGYIQSAHAGCKWWEKYTRYAKKWLFKILG
jgi:hypothetical protein